MIKRLLYSVPLALSMWLVFSTSGCRDKCKNVSCENGECIDGSCVCETGYTGSLCNEPANESFGGAFALVESCTAGDDNYTVVIEADAGTLDKLSITGLWGKQIAASATVQADGNSFEIERQAYGNVELSGSGEYSFAKEDLSVSFRVFQSGASSAFDVCTAELDRK